MRSYRIVMAALLVGTAIGVAMFISHYDSKRLSGHPVRLVSATGSIEPTKDMEPFIHAFFRDEELHLVIREWFHDSSPIASPYITEGERGQGVLHIDVVPSLSLIGTKCEFFRQLEVAIPRDRWKRLESLQVFNEETGHAVGPPLRISNPEALATLVETSRKEVARERLEGTSRGC